MPSRFSKFMIDTTCKEYVHPWVDSCISSTAGLGLESLQHSLRVYTTLYCITLLMKRKIPTKNDLEKTAISILQSTAFLSWSGFTYSMFLCSIRRILGHFNILTVSFLPSFLSSFCAIILERPSRRTMLCLYVSNIATEVLFRMAESRGYIKKIPKGELLIFSIGMSILSYFYKQKRNTDSVFKIMRFGIGKYEEHGYEPQFKSEYTNYYASTKTNHCQQKRFKKPILNIIWHALQVYKSIIDKIKSFHVHPICPHPYSCLHYVLKGSFKMFGLALSAQLALKLIFNWKKVFRKPYILKEIIFKKSNLNLAYFLGGFTCTYRFISCYLRRLYKKDTPEFAAISGFIASFSFFFYSNNTVALYVLWKALQLMWNHAVENNKVPEIKWFVIFLYCFSTAVLFHAAIVEPKHLRPSYMKFLYDISGGRIVAMSRIPIDKFGFNTSKQLREVLIKSGLPPAHDFSF